MIKNLLENYPFHGFTNEFPRIIRRFGIPWNEHIYTTPWRDKEVVVNALTLICQEFCRTRTCGETREERQLEEPLSHTTLWKACCTRTNTLVRAIHLYTSAGQRVSNGFSHRVDVLPKLPNRVSPCNTNSCPRNFPCSIHDFQSRIR